MQKGILAYIVLAVKLYVGGYKNKNNDAAKSNATFIPDAQTIHTSNVRLI